MRGWHAVVTAAKDEIKVSGVQALLVHGRDYRKSFAGKPGTAREIAAVNRGKGRDTSIVHGHRMS